MVPQSTNYREKWYVHCALKIMKKVLFWKSMFASIYFWKEKNNHICNNIIFPFRAPCGMYNTKRLIERFHYLSGSRARPDQKRRKKTRCCCCCSGAYFLIFNCKTQSYFILKLSALTFISYKGNCLMFVSIVFVVIKWLIWIEDMPK